MSIKVGDKVRLKTTYYGNANNGRQVVVTKVRPEHPFPITVDLEGWHAPVTRSEIHTFQDTLDEIGRVSEANNEDNCECSESYRHRGQHTPGCPEDEGDPFEEAEYNDILDLLDRYLYPKQYTTVVKYIDKLRRNQ